MWYFVLQFNMHFISSIDWVHLRFLEICPIQLAFFRCENGKHNIIQHLDADLIGTNNACISYSLSHTSIAHLHIYTDIANWFMHDLIPLISFGQLIHIIHISSLRICQNDAYKPITHSFNNTHTTRQDTTQHKLA